MDYEYFKSQKKTSKKNEQKFGNIVYIYDICIVIRREEIELYPLGIFYHF